MSGHRTRSRGARRAMVGLVVASAVAALAGCAVGPRGDVVRDGVGPSAGPGQVLSTNVNPPTWDPNERNPEKLVERFLATAAGDHGVAASHATIVDRVKNFIDRSSREQWNPSTDVTLVHVLRRTQVPGVDAVEVEVQYRGVLKPDGQVDLREGRHTYKFAFRRDAGTQGLLLSDPPQDLLLDVSNLNSYYLRTPIYFWNYDGTSLVPDLRYLPAAVPVEQRDTRLLDWLLNEPAPWLAPAVLKVPEGTRRLDNVIRDAQHVKVNLAAPGGDAVVYQRLAEQLYWTLSPGNQQLQLQVNRTQVAVPANVLSRNLAAPTPDAPSEAPRYAVVDGALTRLFRPTQSAGRPLPAHVTDAKNVLSAAVAAREDAFALVREVRKGRPELYVGLKGDLLRRVDLNGARDISMPIWLDRAAEVLLVLADGKLWAVTAEGAPDLVDDLRLHGRGGAVTAVSVAPDGRRVALVIGGSLYVAPLLRQGEKVGTFQLGDPRKVPTLLEGSLNGVAFYREDSVVVAGTPDDKLVRLSYVTVDGALETKFETNLRAQVDHLTAYVVEAGRTQRSGAILLDVNGQAHQFFDGTLSLLNETFDAPEPPAPPSPSPSAEPSASSSASPSPPEPVKMSAASFGG